MSASAVSHAQASSPSQHLLWGIAGGVVGGIVFGLMMQMQGMMPMVAMLARSESIIVGWLVHLLISSFIGGVYGIIAARLPATWMTAIVGGIANGVIWWILGALILMPLMLGMGEMVLQIGDMQINSLIGHLIFGVIAAVLFHVMRSRTA